MPFCRLVVVALYCSLIFQGCHAANGKGYVKTKMLSQENWSLAVVNSYPDLTSSISCAAACSAFNQSIGVCNAYKFNGGSCDIANLAFLEEPSAESNSPMEAFHVELETYGMLKQFCHGGEDCCHSGNQCLINEGDCQDNAGCRGLGLICGTDNCLDAAPGRTGGLWDSTDDCCQRRCWPESPCQSGEGHCETDADCDNPGFNICDTKYTCFDIDLFPRDIFPDNTEDNYFTEDNCCRRRCHSVLPCSIDQQGCLTNEDCLPGLKCNDTGFCVDIDECTEDIPLFEAYCGPNTLCINTLGSFNCSCQPGFNSFKVNIGCKDVNECLLSSTNTCNSTIQNCTNTIGSYECICKTGYVMDASGLTCLNVNECLDEALHPNCKNNSYCVDSIGSYTCKCNPGYTGNPLTGCTDLNECIYNLDTCDYYAFCNNTIGNYTCQCKPGYDGNPYVTNGCVDIDECAIPGGSPKCLENSSCKNSIGSYTCVCNPGYTGSGLVGCTDLNECLYSSINTCDSYRANCTNTIGNYTCECKTGYEGNAYVTNGCKDVDECLIPGGSPKCLEHSSCKNSIGAYLCPCDAGYTGNGLTSCTDLNECSYSLDTCDYYAFCNNTIGNYTCECKPGFAGNPYEYNGCNDIDECSIPGGFPKCKDNSVCKNSFGSYTCSCAPGYTGNALVGCTDINECTYSYMNDCALDATCINTDGAYDCVCKPGYQGDPFGYRCTDVDECTSGLHNCTESQFCWDFVGGFKCYDYPTELRCNGASSCCTSSNPCDLLDGHCTYSTHCKLPFVCGYDNCLDFTIPNLSTSFDSYDNCCEPPE